MGGGKKQTYHRFNLVSVSITRTQKCFPLSIPFYIFWPHKIYDFLIRWHLFFLVLPINWKTVFICIIWHISNAYTPKLQNDITLIEMVNAKIKIKMKQKIQHHKFEKRKKKIVRSAGDDKSYGLPDTFCPSRKSLCCTKTHEISKEGKESEEEEKGKKIARIHSRIYWWIQRNFFGFSFFFGWMPDGFCASLNWPMFFCSAFLFAISNKKEGKKKKKTVELWSICIWFYVYNRN